MTRLAASAVATLAIAALPVAGCGGDTEEKNDYVDQVNKVQEEAVEGLSAMSASSPEQGLEIFADINERFAGLVEDLEGIEPPDEVADLHEELIQVLRDFNTAYEEAGFDESDDPAELAPAVSEFTTAAAETQTEFGRVINEINAKLQE